MDRKAIGFRIKELVDEAGINRKKLEDQLHVHYDTIMKWFSGKAIPSHETLIELSEMLNVSIDYILRGQAYYQNSYAQAHDIATGYDSQDGPTNHYLEQLSFYKEKARFFEQRYEEVKNLMLSGKRAGDPKDLDVKKMRKKLSIFSFK